MDAAFAKAIRNRFFANSPQGVLIECGANDGIKGSIGLWFERELGWRCVNIEANPYCFNELVKNRPYAINVELALSDLEGVSTFNFPTNGPRGVLAGQGSLEQSRLKEWGNKKRPVNKISVQVTRYDLLVDRILCTMTDPYYTPVDLLVLDVEGHELSVVRGMTNTQNLPKVIAAETDKVTPDQLLDELSPLGYVKKGKYQNNTFFVRTSHDI